MTHRDARAREVMEAIGAVLLNDWDPIGVQSFPTAQDEYASYIGGVYRLLASGASEFRVAEHLSQIETEKMGFEKARLDDLIPVARKLLALNVGIGEGPAA